MALTLDNNGENKHQVMPNNQALADLALPGSNSSIL